MSLLGLGLSMSYGGRGPIVPPWVWIAIAFMAGVFTMAVLS